jgi:putative tryptophan/tyrosine transport system substrate-binding protein
VNRRRFLMTALVGALAAPLASEAQQWDTPTRIGILTPQSRQTSARLWDAFRQGLRELGWDDGRNIVIETRFADGRLERLPALAEELINIGVSVIVAANSPGRAPR